MACSASSRDTHARPIARPTTAASPSVHGLTVRRGCFSGAGPVAASCTSWEAGPCSLEIASASVAACSSFIKPYREITNSRSTLPLQPSGWVGPKSIIMPTSSLPALVLMPVELPAESSTSPVEVELESAASVELPLVAAGALVIAGPVENPGGSVPPQAARTRAARMGARVTPRG